MSGGLGQLVALWRIGSKISEQKKPAVGAAIKNKHTKNVMFWAKDTGQTGDVQLRTLVQLVAAGGGSLRNANLRGADLHGLCLSGVDFRGADLRDCDLAGANLRRSNLFGADLTGATWDGADFFEAVMTATKPLDASVLGLVDGGAWHGNARTGASDKVFISPDGQVTIGRKVRKPAPAWLGGVIASIVLAVALVATGTVASWQGALYDKCIDLDWDKYELCMAGEDF